MGNTPPTTTATAKPGVASLKNPLRPFVQQHSKSKKCSLRQASLLSSSSSRKYNNNALQTLIWCQDWQKVLIRLTLYPTEARQTLQVTVYDLHLVVYPLHLICALDPPAAVVQLACQCFADVAALPIQVQRQSRRRQQRYGVPQKVWQVRRHWRAWRRQRRGAFPVYDVDWENDDEDGNASVEQRQLLLPYVDDMANNYVDDQASAWSDAAESSCSSSSSSDRNSSKSSLSSNHSNDENIDDDKVILQLSPSGGLKCMTPTTTPGLDVSNETQSTATSSGSIYRVKWDLKPLWKQVAATGMLLPLHVACLFQANPAVIEALVQTYPLAALSDVLGMLPIHWIAAGWTLPPLQPPPEQPVPRDPKPGPLPSLHVLRRALPECLQIRSGNHGMLAEDYIAECMEESDYKQLCLRVLSEGIDYMIGSLSLLGDQQTIVFCDTDQTDETSSYPSLRLFAGLSGLILEEDWTKAALVVQEDPSSARKWYYGVSSETVGTTVWKRLPIHLAAANGAPLELIDLLLTVFSDSALVEDPHDGSLALHIACRAAASLPVVRRLVTECPEAVLAVDAAGRVPLHVAVMNGSPYAVVEYLVLQDLESVVALDINGRTPMDYAMELDPKSSSNRGPLVDFMTMILLKLDRS